MKSRSVVACVAAIRKLLPDFDSMKKLEPATDGQLHALETAIGLVLPSELAEWLQLLNGHNHGFCFAIGWSFLSTEEIKMHWGFFADPKAGIAPLLEHTDHPHRVRVPANHKSRIPIAADYSGNLLVIDTEPVDSKFSDQVLFVKRDSEGEAFVVFDSFVDLLDEITAQITVGNICVSDGNIQFRDNPGMLRGWYQRARQFRKQPWSASDSDRALVASLTAEQRSACYQGQNDLLQTEQFAVEDLDLVRSIVVTAGLARDPHWLRSFPFLSNLRIDGDGNPTFFAVLADLHLSNVYLQPHTDAGLEGLEALRGNTSIQKVTAFRVDQSGFDILTTLPNLVQLATIASNVHDISGIAQLPRLLSLYVNDSGKVDATPAYQHPTLAEFSLTWRRCS
jgi:cell wall assembly regulator SMI1